MMPVHRVTFSYRIDMGIFLLFLDVCLAHEHISFERTLYDDRGEDDAEKTLAAIYSIP